MKANNVTAFDIATMLLSVIAIVIVSSLFFYPADSQLRALLVNLDTLICSIFILHFIVSAIRSPSIINYIKQNWIDLVASIPMVEGLRFLRFFHAYKLLRAVQRQRNIMRNLKDQQVESTIASILFTLLMIILLGSISILLVEQDQTNGQIHSAGEALWWAIVTISTVGYGDFVPVSDAGRVIAGIMILTGVGFFGAVSGLMSAILLHGKSLKNAPLEHFIREQRKEQHALKKQLSEIQQQLAELKQQQK